MQWSSYHHMCVIKLPRKIDCLTYRPYLHKGPNMSKCPWACFEIYGTQVSTSQPPNKGSSISSWETGQQNSVGSSINRLTLGRWTGQTFGWRKSSVASSVLKQCTCAFDVIVWKLDNMLNNLHSFTPPSNTLQRSIQTVEISHNGWKTSWIHEIGTTATNLVGSVFPLPTCRFLSNKHAINRNFCSWGAKDLKACLPWPELSGSWTKTKRLGAIPGFSESEIWITHGICVHIWLGLSSCLDQKSHKYL